MYWASVSRGNRKKLRKTLTGEKSLKIKGVTIELISHRGYTMTQLDFIMKGNQRGYATMMEKILDVSDFKTEHLTSNEIMSGKYSNENGDLLFVDIREGDTKGRFAKDLKSLGEKKSATIKIDTRGIISFAKISSIIMITNIKQKNADKILKSSGVGISVTVYNYDNIFINPLSHNLTPQHEIVSDILFTDLSALPKIKSDDIVIKFIGGVPGDLIKISIDGTISFRVVTGLDSAVGFGNENLPCSNASKEDFKQTNTYDEPQKIERLAFGQSADEIND